MSAQEKQAEDEEHVIPPERDDVHEALPDEIDERLPHPTRDADRPGHRRRGKDAAEIRQIERVARLAGKEHVHPLHLLGAHSVDQHDAVLALGTGLDPEPVQTGRQSRRPAPGQHHGVVGQPQFTATHAGETELKVRQELAGRLEIIGHGVGRERPGVFNQLGAPAGRKFLELGLHEVGIGVRIRRRKPDIDLNLDPGLAVQVEETTHRNVRNRMRSQTCHHAEEQQEQRPPARG